MSSLEFEQSNENTPLIKNNTIDSSINYTSKVRETSNFEDSKLLILGKADFKITLGAVCWISKHSPFCNSL